MKKTTHNSQLTTHNSQLTTHNSLIYYKIYSIINNIEYLSALHNFFYNKHFIKKYFDYSIYYLTIKNKIIYFKNRKITTLLSIYLI